MSADSDRTLPVAAEAFQEPAPGSPLGVTRRTFVRGALAGLGVISRPTLLAACSAHTPASVPPADGLDGVAKPRSAPATPGVRDPPT